MIRTILLGLAATLAFAAQDSPGDYSFSGTVVNSVTGAPVKGAEVTLVALSNVEAGAGSPAKGAEVTAVVLTNGEAGAGAPPDRPGPMVAVFSTGAGGEYLFSGLAAGLYMLNAVKPGFVPAGGGREPMECIAVSASVSGHTIRLAPFGAIDGKLSNQYGDPLAGAAIVLFERYVEDGVRSVRMRSGAVTDDRGEFRVWDLPPGRYYVQARREGEATSLQVGDRSVRYSPWEGFHPVFFGGAHNMDSATPVEVTAGGQARADFDITMEPTYKVRGTLRNFVPGQPVVFDWLESGTDAVARGVVQAAVLDEKTGKFELDGVPGGQYTLRAVQGHDARAETAVTVKDGDVNGVAMTLIPAVPVTGRVRPAGAAQESRAAPLAEGAMEPAQPAPANCFVSLEPSSSEPCYGCVGRRAEDGEFFIAGVFPGQYRFRAQCTNGYVVSAVSGGADLLANPEIAVPAGAAIPPIEIAVKAGGGSLRARLAVSSAPPGTGMLLARASAPSTGPVFQAAFPAPSPTGEPEYEFGNLAPGDYLAYAFSDLQSVEYRSPGFLDALTGGTGVHIEDGKTTVVTLTSLVK